MNHDPTEAEFQQVVVDMAAYCGWQLIYHTHDSRHSAAGFPDLVMLRGTRMVVAELKSQKGKLTAAQMNWYGGMIQVADASNGAVQAYVWRPSDLDDIEKVLQRSTHPVSRP
jgi:hypothetical protein